MGNKRGKKTNKTPATTQKERRELAKAMLLQEPALPDRVIARYFNISHSTIGRFRKELTEAGSLDQTRIPENDWVNHPYIKANPSLLDNLSEKSLRSLRAPGVLDRMQEKVTLSPVYAQRLLHKERLAAAENAFVALTEADIVLRCDDVRNGLDFIESDSIDALIVDPPYHASAVPLYKSIAEVAARVLKPQGLLIVMTGQSHFDKVMRAIGEVDGLVYHWLLTVLTLRGGSTMLPWLGACPYHKPVLLYIRGKRTWNKGIFSDVIETAPPDKTHRTLHHWQQDLAGFQEIVKRFTSKGDTVLDCCCGSSTTGAACITLGRRYIGVDIDPESIKTSKERLLALLKEQVTAQEQSEDNSTEQDPSC